MHVKKYLNASEAAALLGVHRPRFYEIIREFSLSPFMQTGRIKLYKISDLNVIRRELRNDR